jgi:predicted Fe-Mo cluster-binding NifX family protein
MKIAVITDDGKTVSQHFGYAPYYLVFTIEGKKVVGQEQRDKAGHHNLGGGHHEEQHVQGQPHGLDAASQSKHATMMDNISDCQLLIAGGMGYGAYQSLKSRNIDVIITDVENIAEAVQLYLEGKLVNLQEERLH